MLDARVKNIQNGVSCKHLVHEHMLPGDYKRKDTSASKIVVRLSGVAPCTAICYRGKENQSRHEEPYANL